MAKNAKKAKKAKKAAKKSFAKKHSHHARVTDWIKPPKRKK
jgi:hypothetical protein